MKFTQDEYKKICIKYMEGRSAKKAIEDALTPDRYSVLPNVCKYRRAKNVIDEAIDAVFPGLQKNK